MRTKEKHESKPTDIHLWKWWYRALMPDGSKVKFSGTVEAPNDRMGQTASRALEKMMRKKYPQARWMQGRDIDSLDGRVRYGPTVQRGKFLRFGEEAVSV
jgi:hypothetical protein